MECKNCGKQIPDKAKFCRYCGNSTEPLPEEGDSCPNCGAPLRPGAKFCRSCGAKVEAQIAEAVIAEEPSLPEPVVIPEKAVSEKTAPVNSVPAVRKKKHWPVVAAVLIALAVGAAIAAPLLKKQPSDGNSSEANFSETATEAPKITTVSTLPVVSVTTTTTTTSEPAPPDPALADPTNMSTLPSVQINRRTRIKETPMSDDGVWTIFVYLCGSDLESGKNKSGGGNASRDIEEMRKVSASKNVRFVIEAAGSTAWKIEDIDPTVINRIIIVNGKATISKLDKNGNMGTPSTLTDFLNWGLDNYTSEHMGVILWDHGSGSIWGACNDENFDDDSLKLKEIDAAFYNVFDRMTSRFDFIGFDACLMATSETAALMATHGKYLVASQELEPGRGWDYTALGNYIVEHPDADARSVCKAIVDGYAESNNRNPEYTLSVIDLSCMDDLIKAFDNYSKELYNMTQYPEVCGKRIRSIRSGETFGTHSSESSISYSNMIDLKALTYGANAAYSKALDKAIDEAVIYMKNGSEHSGACGLSVFYPMQKLAEYVMPIFNDVCMSPSYLAFTDRVAYSASTGCNMETFDNTEIYSLYNNDFGPDKFNGEPGSYYYEFDTYDHYQYKASYTPDETLKISKSSYSGNDLYLHMTIASDSLKYLSDVYSIVAEIRSSGGKKYQILYGLLNNCNVDYSTGEVSAKFDGAWYTLQNGAPLYLIPTDKTNGTAHYVSPVRWYRGGGNNYTDAVLFLSIDQNNKASITGISDSVNASGIPDRIYSLENGDKIETYLIKLADEGGSLVPTEEPWTYSGDNALARARFTEGTYVFYFGMTDIYGEQHNLINYDTLDNVGVYEIEGGKITVLTTQ